MSPRGGTILGRYLPYGAHVILLFTLAFASFILSVLVTFSSPFIGAISFLRLLGAGGPTTFGAFGWCSPDYCLHNLIAYEYGTQVDRAMTGAMFLWPIAVIFTFFTLVAILPLLFVHESRALRYVGNRTFFLFASDMAAIVIAVAWLLTIYGWSIAKRAFQVAGAEAHLGAATWMGLVATICVVLIAFLNWPAEAWDGVATVASGGRGRGLPPANSNAYYHYKRTTRDIVPR